jgi:hypothetical protein
LVLTVHKAYAGTRHVFGEAGSMFTTSDGNVQRYVDAGGGTLSDEEWRRYLQPLTTPIADPPPPPQGRPIDNEPTGTIMPGLAPLPPGPTTIVNPVGPQPTFEDFIYTVVGVDDPQRGFPIRDDFDNHLINVDGRNGSTVSGRHNLDEFKKWVTDQGGQFEVRPTGTPGIYEIDARIPRGDDPTQMRDLDPKTVYDPSVYSSDQMNQMARDAGAQGWTALQEGKVQLNSSGRGSIDVMQG